MNINIFGGERNGMSYSVLITASQMRELKQIELGNAVFTVEDFFKELKERVKP